jgi:hypothetical protein
MVPYLIFPEKNLYAILIQTQNIILHVGQGFSLVSCNPEGLPYKRFNAFVIIPIFLEGF